VRQYEFPNNNFPNPLYNLSWLEWSGFKVLQSYICERVWRSYD